MPNGLTNILHKGRKLGGHSGTFYCKDLVAHNNVIIKGDLSFGDASVDSFVIKGRVSTGSEAGSAVDIGASYTYGELMEIRSDVSSWTGVGTSFNGMYFRTSASTGSASGSIHSLYVYGVSNITSGTTGLDTINPLYVEMLVKAGTGNKTFTTCKAIEANISIENPTSGTLTFTNNVYALEAKVQTGSGCADYTKFCGIKIGGRNDGVAKVYGNGLDIADPEATVCTWTNGINLTTGCAVGLNIAMTATATTGKGIKSYISLATGNYGDGYAANEFDLTLTGTVTGHVAAMSSWINVITGITGANMVCAQSNGVYEEATGTLTNTTVIFGMRMQSLLAEAPSESFPFSCVSNTNIITALFSCNAGSSDMGTITNAGGDSGKLVPLYKETSTGTTYYVKLYSLAG